MSKEFKRWARLTYIKAANKKPIIIKNAQKAVFFNESGFIDVRDITDFSLGTFSKNIVESIIWFKEEIKDKNKKSREYDVY